MVALVATTASARSKNRAAVYQNSGQIGQLDTALKSNDVESATAMAAAIYQQATNAPALQSTDPAVIIDPVLVAQTAEFNRAKTAYEIAACFYRHAQLDIANQWAMTTVTGATLSEEYARRATVLLGNIATAMDRNDQAVTNFLSVITLANLNHEQPAAYAGLLELLMLQKQDDQVAQWVQHGQAKFAGAGDFELDFLKQVSATLKRRNYPLWRELDQQIVDSSSGSPGTKLNSLRRLASNARKFGRWAEAETNYAAICALQLGSAQDDVDAYLFLAESQTKQSKDFASTLQILQSNATAFAQSADREYAAYRVAKFYEEQGNLDSAAANYQALVSGSSTSSWAAAALHQFGALKEKQGDLQAALQLYLQYPQRFPQDARFVFQSYGSALSVATSLNDTNRAAQIVGTITNNAAAIQDYNTQLNLAFYFKKRGNQQLALRFYENGLSLAQRALTLASNAGQRSLIHFRVLRRMNDFDQYQRIVDYFATNVGDFPGPSAEY
jgi:tetratricopeptide (TPR) repeat protein